MTRRHAITVDDVEKPTFQGAFTIFSTREFTPPYIIAFSVKRLLDVSHCVIQQRRRGEVDRLKRRKRNLMQTSKRSPCVVAPSRLPFFFKRTRNKKRMDKKSLVTFLFFIKYPCMSTSIFRHQEIHKKQSLGFSASCLMKCVRSAF